MRSVLCPLLYDLGDEEVRGLSPLCSARCQACSASQTATQAGSGALISSAEDPIDLIVVPANTETQRAEVLLSAQAGDVIIAIVSLTGLITPAVDTAMFLEIRINDVLENIADRLVLVAMTGVGVSGFFEGTHVARFISPGGNIEISTYITVGAAFTPSSGQLVVMHYRSPPP